MGLVSKISAGIDAGFSCKVCNCSSVIPNVGSTVWTCVFLVLPSSTFSGNLIDFLSSVTFLC